MESQKHYFFLNLGSLNSPQFFFSIYDDGALKELKLMIFIFISILLIHFSVFKRSGQKEKEKEFKLFFDKINQRDLVKNKIKAHNK